MSVTTKASQQGPTLQTIMPGNPAPTAQRRPPRKTIPPAGGTGDSGRFNEPIGGWSWRWGFLIPLLLFILGTVSVVSTQRLIGYAWDEAYYYEPAKDAAGWVLDTVSDLIDTGGDLTRLPSWASIKSSIDRDWEERHEHPSFQKLLSGFSLLSFENIIGPIYAMRLPIAILFGASLTLIYLLGRRTWGPQAGVLGALAYWAMPQIFGFAHFATMETPLVFSTLLFIYCFIRGIDSRFWAFLTGVSLGLLLATKINGFFLIPPMILWGYVYARQRAIHNFFSMLILAPICFVAFWPWLWPDPVHRFLDYINFHAGHQQTALYFEGIKYGFGGEPAPFYYPSIMVAVTVPVSILALAAFGLLESFVAIFRRPLAALYLLLGVVTWAVASAPGTPKYDGVRLFLPLFAFIALLAGGGAHLFVAFANWLDRRRDPWGSSNKLLKIVSWGLALVILTDGGIAISRYYPYLLSYFNPLAGGIKGAEERGFEVTYWGEAVNEDVIKEINEKLPKEASLKVLALHEKCFEHLQKWKKLREDIKLGGDPPYDAHLLLWRRGFFLRPEKALSTSNAFPPIAEWKKNDVTLLTLHRTGPAFEAYWPTIAPPPGAREVEKQAATPPAPIAPSMPTGNENRPTSPTAEMTPTPASTTLPMSEPTSGSMIQTSSDSQVTSPTTAAADGASMVTEPKSDPGASSPTMETKSEIEPNSPTTTAPPEAAPSSPAPSPPEAGDASVIEKPAS
ncbi:glycosyltransferase family 39 protein [Candidatus Sumerlaeota bacterium]|nr:glycosyltransferase family 39 protein [Candidatus Sumerlaeota bacterium]